MDTQLKAVEEIPEDIQARKDLLTTEEVRAFFHVSERQVWQWYHFEGLPYLNLGKKCIRFRWEDVEQWMLARRHVDRSA
jgi:predicted DNA-binding transcriptional regulator AlpA